MSEPKRIAIWKGGQLVEVYQPVRVRQIISETAARHGLRTSDIVGRSLERRVFRARAEALALCREQTRFSLPQLGDYFGGRDHSTVWSAIRRHAEIKARGPRLSHAGSAAPVEESAA